MGLRVRALGWCVFQFRFRGAVFRGLGIFFRCSSADVGSSGFRLSDAGTFCRRDFQVQMLAEAEIRKQPHCKAWGGAGGRSVYGLKALPKEPNTP